jgi:hypothetical protein
MRSRCCGAAGGCDVRVVTTPGFLHRVNPIARLRAPASSGSRGSRAPRKLEPRQSERHIRRPRVDGYPREEGSPGRVRIS